MCTCFSDFKKVIQACYDGTAPGGWCEWQDAMVRMEHVGPVPEDCGIARWVELTRQAALKMGRDWAEGENYKRYFEEAGFVNVVERRFYWPMGTWAKGDYFKSLGAYFVEDTKRIIEAISMKLLPLIGWSRDEIQVLLAQVRRDMEDPNVHAYTPV